MIEEKNQNNTQDKDMEKLLKGYVDTVFNVWRMGKDAKLNYEINKKKLDDINNILDHHISFILDVEQNFNKINRTHGRVLRKNGIVLKFVDSFNVDEYIETVNYHKKSLEKTLIPVKNLTKKYDRTLKILKKNGFQILEFDGKKFNEGMSVRVLGYDSKPDVEEDVIIETVKPSIFFNDKEYLKGEVIVSRGFDEQ